MRARGKHNWTASRKARLISMLTASTASQSVSRSNRQVTSSHLSSCAHFQDVAAIKAYTKWCRSGVPYAGRTHRCEGERGVGNLAPSSRLRPRLASWTLATPSRQVCTKRGPTSYGLATCVMGRVLACWPISSRSRTVVRLYRPQALSLSVKALRQRMHQNRRLYNTNSTRYRRLGTSRLARGRTSCCLTHTAPQCGHVSRFFVAITSTRSFPSPCTSCLRIRRPSNSKGTTIPCAWFVFSSVLCWLGIACPPADLAFFILTKSNVGQASCLVFPQFHPKGWRPLRE